jgi:hypothetical protein
MAPGRLSVMSPEICLPQKGSKYTAQEVTAFRLLLGRPYTLPSGSGPSCFYLERDAPGMFWASK